MWVAKIEFDGKNSLIGSKTLKHKVTFFGYPLSYTTDKKWIIVQATGTLFGKTDDKKNFVRDLKKEKRVINLELNDDFLIGIIKEPVYTKKIYNSNIVHISPGIISQNGRELIEIASFDRSILTDAINSLKKNLDAKLISIQNKKIKSLSVMKVRADLTPKQKGAMELAIKHGYYQYPRQIDLVKLAKLADLSFSTYQVHLRKAEAKIIPNNFE